MLKAERQRTQNPNQRIEHNTDTFAATLPQGVKTAQLAAMMSNSPHQVAQAQLQDRVHNSARQAVQRKALHSFIPSPVAVAQLVNKPDGNLGIRMRQFGRWWNNKKLPPNLYRWDGRTPADIAQLGFQPWKPEGTIKLTEHVFGSLEKNGLSSKMESQWVSTSAFGMIKIIDPVLAQGLLGRYLYKIDAAKAEATENSTEKFVDANAHFDAIGIRRPYASQREYARQGGIPAQAVVSYMTGAEYMEQYDFQKNELKTGEADLASWKAMPTA